jgi:hypothetical protein
VPMARSALRSARTRAPSARRAGSDIGPQLSGTETCRCFEAIGMSGSSEIASGSCTYPPGVGAIGLSGGVNRGTTSTPTAARSHDWRGPYLPGCRRPREKKPAIRGGRQVKGGNAAQGRHCNPSVSRAAPMCRNSHNAGITASRPLLAAEPRPRSQTPLPWPGCAGAWPAG